jgi:hypothetical protein
MTAKSLITVNYRHNAAEQFIDSFVVNQYYLFVSNHIDANTASRPFNNEQDTIVSCYHGMIFGKRSCQNDATLMIPRVDWQTNTVYDIYDHRDPGLYDKEFYVVTPDGSNFNVFKCLENGNGNPSTVAPTIDNVSLSNDNFFYPTDGYRWKFMYTISQADFDKFSTADYVPVYTSANVSSMATAGSLDVIKVESPGKDTTIILMNICSRRYPSEW